MKRSHWCVPSGSSPSICSAPTMATAYDLLVRLIVEMTRLPPGLVSATSEAQNSGTLLTCSMTSEATTASKVAPANQVQTYQCCSSAGQWACASEPQPPCIGSRDAALHAPFTISTEDQRSPTITMMSVHKLKIAAHLLVGPALQLHSYMRSLTPLQGQPGHGLRPHGWR